MFDKQHTMIGTNYLSNPKYNVTNPKYRFQKQFSWLSELLSRKPRNKQSVMPPI